MILHLKLKNFWKRLDIQLNIHQVFVCQKEDNVPRSHS